jgi:hypothetical protein
VRLYIVHDWLIGLALSRIYLVPAGSASFPYLALEFLVGKCSAGEILVSVADLLIGCSAIVMQGLSLLVHL